MATPNPVHEASPTRGSRRPGFTLIEILVVVMILGLASAVIVPQLGSRDDLKTASAARMLMADLIYAQNLSIARQQMHYVKVDAVAENYTVLSEVSPETIITHPVQIAPFVVKFGASSKSALSDVVVDSVSFNGFSTIGFDEMGVPHAYDATGGVTALTSGSVVLRCGEFTLTVLIEPFTGELKIN